jgi:hypothetical protein
MMPGRDGGASRILRLEQWLGPAALVHVLRLARRYPPPPEPAERLDAGNWVAEARLPQPQHKEEKAPARLLPPQD